VLRLGCKDEARIAHVVDVPFVIVMVHPRRQPCAQTLDEGQRDLLEGRSPAFGGERDVEHGHAACERFGGRQNARRQVGEHNTGGQR
jgi:hypothetical protein